MAVEAEEACGAIFPSIKCIRLKCESRKRVKWRAVPNPVRDQRSRHAPNRAIPTANDARSIEVVAFVIDFV